MSVIKKLKRRQPIHEVKREKESRTKVNSILFWKIINKIHFYFIRLPVEWSKNFVRIQQSMAFVILLNENGIGLKGKLNNNFRVSIFEF